jgi:hypothetical protein
MALYSTRAILAGRGGDVLEMVRENLNLYTRSETKAEDPR